MTYDLDEDDRRVIFAAAAAARGWGMESAAAREHVAAAFGVTPKQVRDVELEGVRKRWLPPGDRPPALGTCWTPRPESDTYTS